MSLYETGIRPQFDAYIKKKSEQRRDYGKYWSASSAGYCMRLNILKRLQIEPVPEIAEDAMRTHRVFESGHVFHEWAQRITRDAGLSIAQEIELQDEDLLIRGHIDDLVLVSSNQGQDTRLILYDYKTANSQAFNYKRPEIGHYHKMQLATYMYMLRQDKGKVVIDEINTVLGEKPPAYWYKDLSEARIMQISKDDLRMMEQQLIWTPGLEREVVGYWKTLNGYWEQKMLPQCTCLNHDGGFMGRRSKKGKVYNPFFHNDEPCADSWVKDKLPEGWTC